MEKDITYQKIERDLGLGYYFRRIGMSVDYQASLIDFIKEYRNKTRERLVLFRVVVNYTDDETLKLFIAWCIKEIIKNFNNSEPETIKVCNIIEKLVKGQGIEDVLDTTLSAAMLVAWSNDWVNNREINWIDSWDIQLEQLSKMIKEFD